MADGRDDRLRGELLFVDIESLHDGAHGTLGVIGIIDGKGLGIADLFAMCAQNAHTDRVEGAAPDVLREGLVRELLGEAVFDLACGLVGKGDGQHTVGRAGIVNEFGQDLLDLLGGEADGGLQLGHVCLIKIVGDKIRMISVSVTDDMGNAAHQHGGLAASRSCQHEQGALGMENSRSLTLVERGIDLIKQRLLGFYVPFGEFVHGCPLS